MNIRTWDVATGKPCFAGGVTHPLTSIIVCDDNRTVLGLARSVHDRIFRWDRTTGKALEDVRISGWRDKHAFSADGRSLYGVTANDHSLCCWDTRTGAEIRPNIRGRRDIRGHGGIAIDQAEKTLAVADHHAGQVHLWEIASGRVQRVIQAHQRLNYAALSPDGARLVTGGHKEPLKLWDVTTGKDQQTFQPSAGRHGLHYPLDPHYLSFSPDVRLLLAAFYGHLQVWDVASGQSMWTLQREGGDTAVQPVFSPDGRSLAVGDYRGVVRLFETATWAERRTFHGHVGAISAFAFTPDGRALLSASRDSTILVWDLTAEGPK